MAKVINILNESNNQKRTNIEDDKRECLLLKRNNFRMHDLDLDTTFWVNVIK